MLALLLRGSRRRPLAVLALAAGCAAGGCSYTSEYTIPAPDGRARVVWRESDVALDTGGLNPVPGCWSEVGRLANVVVGENAPVRVAPTVFWAPRYYGAPIVVLRAGLAPPLLRPPLFLPILVLRGLRGPSVRPPSLGVGLGGGGGGRGGGGDLGKAAIILLIIAVLVMSAVDLTLAIANPETSASSHAIDEMNALNDLMRTPGTPCSGVFDTGGDQ